jgi:PIN domain nuclease of toxin-antitoxin system
VRRFLLDTHIWLWSDLEPHKLTSEVHQLLADPEALRFLSSISLWELAVLVEKKKLVLKDDFAKWVSRSASDLRLSEVALSWKVVNEMRYVLPGHRDPADRFLVATAIAYDLIFVTADRKLLVVPGLKVLANL